MARAGIRALEFYDPKNKKHGQAHMQARWVIFAVLYHPSNRTIRLGITQFLIKGGIARLEEMRSSDGKLENAYVRVCRASLRLSCPGWFI